MNIQTTKARGLFLGMCLFGMCSAAYAQTQNGEWTISGSEVPGKVHISFESARDGEHEFSNSSDWNLSDFQGLDLATPEKHDVHFTLARDAGRLEAEGFARDGQGAGLFTFRANPQYSRDMEALGFPGITDERLFSFALHDVSLAYAREMKGLGLEGLDANKLLACRIFHVDAAFVNELRAAGVNVTSADRLIAFRIHKVTPDFIRDLRSAGLNVTDPDKLVAFRIHKVSPDFVKDLERLGYARPEPDQLIALRIHGVTPEYIEKLRAHGIQNLTLDQLVKLRIHGIE